MWNHDRGFLQRSTFLMSQKYLAIFHTQGKLFLSRRNINLFELKSFFNTKKFSSTQRIFLWIKKTFINPNKFYLIQRNCFLSVFNNMILTLKKFSEAWIFFEFHIIGWKLVFTELLCAIIFFWLNVQITICPIVKSGPIKSLGK